MVPGSRRDLAARTPGTCRDSYRDSWREAGFPAGSRRESCLDSWREARFLAAKISAGSRQNLAGNLGGKRDPGGQTLGKTPAGVLPGFLVGDGILGGQNLGRIPVGVLPGFLAGNWISRWECCRDLRRETKFLAVKIFPAAKISGAPVWNLARIRDDNIININQTTRC